MLVIAGKGGVTLPLFPSTNFFRQLFSSTFSVNFVKIDTFWRAPSHTTSSYSIDNLSFVII